MSDYNKPPRIEKDGRLFIYDLLRKKYVVATPEEEVRQQLLEHLVNELSYPKGLISVESGLVYNKQVKRTDVVVYNNLGAPYMLIECKRNEVQLKKEAVYQLASYNRQLNAQVLVITNGKQLICLQVDPAQNKLIPLKEIPPYRRENS